MKRRKRSGRLCDSSQWRGGAPAASLAKEPGAVGQELVLSVYNYRGPSKIFWEHRSLSGPFYRGNVSNGFVVAVESKDAMTAEEFTRTLQSASVDDRLDGSSRRITFDSAHGKLALEYDLRELRL
jgi:hypothetical protein